MGHRSTRIGLIFALLALIAIAFAPPVSATKPNPDHKVTICHRTNSDTNPYVQITVDIASSGFLKAGHNNHTGPLWDPTLKDQHVKWGDIIPPYTYGDFTFDGLNWTDAGREVYDNGCTFTPTPTPTVSPSGSVEPTPTPTATATPSGEPSNTPTNTPTVPGRGSSTPPPTDTAGQTVSATQPPAALVLIFALIAIASGVLIGSALTARAERLSSQPRNPVGFRPDRD